MKLDEIYKRLQKINIPIAYNHFRESVKPPYITYYEDGGQNYGADCMNLLRKRNVVINLFTKKKEPELEVQIEKLINDFETDVSEIYILDEDLVMITYKFETIEKIR